MREELAIEVELGPLVGIYSRPEDRVVLIVFHARALGKPQRTAEAAEVHAFALDELPWEELAFGSTEQALYDAFGEHSAAKAHPASEPVGGAGFEPA